MKKTRKNMLRSSAAMLLVSALALTTATYAWFTTGHGGSVQQITLTAQNDSGIQLSADAVNWKGLISLTDLINAQGSSGTNTMIYDAAKGLLAPRSSTVEVDSNGELTLYSLSTNEETGFVSTGDGSKDDIVKFDLYARNTGTEAKTLYLDLNKAAVKESGTSTGIENAIRVALINEGEQKIENSADGTSYVDKAKALSSSTASLNNSKIWLWEPNSTTHRTDSLYQTGTAVKTRAIKESIKDTDEVTLSDKGIIEKDSVTKEVSPTLDATATAKISTIASIPANTIVKFKVYIWLEGQDVDCTDQAANGSFTVDLVFTDENK